jgi:hypothetical protein
MSLIHDLLVLLGFAHDEPAAALSVALFDRQGRPMPGAPYLIRVDGEDRKGAADADGLANAGEAPQSGTVTVAWRRRPEDYPGDLDPLGPDDYEYSAELAVVLDPDPTKATAQRLGNLGYFGGASPADDVAAFESAHGLAATGDATDADFQAALIREHDGLEITRPARSAGPGASPEEE